MSEQALDRCADLLEPAHFYREGHGAIFGAMLVLRKRGDPVETLVLAAELERLGIMDKVGGKSRLSELVGLTTATSNVGHHAHLVIEAYRSRNLYRAALAVEKAAMNGGLTTHPELLDTLEHAMSEARILPGEPGIPEGPVFLAAHDFAASHFDAPPPLLGTEETAVIATGSLNVLAGRPGSGKTTLCLDLACHLAAGLDWPPRDDTGRAPSPWSCPRPLRIAIVENEGPQAMFASKVQAKLERFPHSIRENGGSLIIQSWRWGAFSFGDRDAFQRAQRELEEQEIDLVIGDPLLSLGPEGVGSPRETSDFVQLLRPLGLGTHRAFLFLHHFRERVDAADDELSRLSGAWGGHLDTLITLAATGSKDQVRLAYPKLRWNTHNDPPPIILGKVFNTRSFEAIGEEGDTSMLEPAIFEFLSEGKLTNRGRSGWHTNAELAAGMKQRRTHITKALEGAPHIFVKRTGADAKALGAKSPRAILWGLAEWEDSDEGSLGPVQVEGESEDQTSFSHDDGIPF